LSNENPPQGQGHNEERGSSRISRISGWVFARGVTIPILVTVLLIIIGLLYYGTPLKYALLGPVQSFRQAELKDASIQGYLRMGNSFLNAGRPDAAKAEYQQTLKLDSNNAQAQLGLRISELYEQSKKDVDTLKLQVYEEEFLDEDSRYFTRASAKEAQDLDAVQESHLLVFLGQARLFYLAPERALELFQEAAKINPENSYAIHNMGLVHEIQNEPDKALEMYQEAFRMDPWNSSYQNNVAFALYKNRQHDDAAIQYEDLLRGDPRYITAYFELPQVYRVLNRLDEAHTYQRQLIKYLDDEDVTSLEKNQGGLFYATDPQSPPVLLVEDPEKKYYAYYSMALTSHLLGNEEEAEGHVDRARNLQIDPDLESEVERLMEHNIQILQEEQDRFRDEVDDFKNKFLNQEETGQAAAAVGKAKAKAGGAEAGGAQAKTLPSTGGADIVALSGLAAALLVSGILLVRRIIR
jgi:tetratricopeptide (TPR) repeat protein